MSKILELVKKDNTIGYEPNPEVVEFLERVLEDAKSGLLNTVVVIGTTIDGQVASGWTPVTDVFILAGAIANVQYEFLAKEIEHR